MTLEDLIDFSFEEYSFEINTLSKDWHQEPLDGKNFVITMANFCEFLKDYRGKLINKAKEDFYKKKAEKNGGEPNPIGNPWIDPAYEGSVYDDIKIDDTKVYNYLYDKQDAQGGGYFRARKNGAPILEMCYEIHIPDYKSFKALSPYCGLIPNVKQKEKELNIIAEMINAVGIALLPHVDKLTELKNKKF